MSSDIGRDNLLSLPADLLRVIGRHVGLPDLLHLACTCRWLHDVLGPLLPFRAAEPEVKPVLLDWTGNYLRKRVMSHYHLLVEAETPLATNPLVRTAASSLHFWWHEDAAYGFDVLAFLCEGKLCCFKSWEMGLSTITQQFLQEDIVIPDSPITVRHITGLLPAGLMCQNVDQTVAGMWRVGPLLHVRSVAAFLGEGLRIIRQEVSADPVYLQWLHTHFLLFQIARLTHRWDEHPHVSLLLGSPLDCSIAELLDQVKTTCNTHTFWQYDGYFSAHSCGELYARPFLDLAAVLAHSQVVFEKEAVHAKTDSYLARNIEALPLRHWADMTVVGLAILFFAFLESNQQGKYRLIRFDSEKFSGDCCSLASYDLCQLPSKLGDGASAPQFALGSRFVVASKLHFGNLRPSVKFADHYAKRRYPLNILVVEPHLRLTLIRDTP